MSKTGFLHIALAATACAIVVVLHLVEIPITSRATARLIEGLHAPGFGVVAISAMLFLRRHMPLGAAYLRAGGFAFFLALASEAAQYFGARDADGTDFAWDMLGISGFLALTACIEFRSLRETRWAGYFVTLSISLLATFSAIAPAAYNSWILVCRAYAVPVIASFDHSWEAGIYRPLGTTELSVITPASDWPVKEGQVIAIDLVPIRYSGIVIDPYSDWSDFEAISFLAASADGKNHEIEIRIHDVNHNQEWDDRYNEKLSVGPDVVKYEISMENIRNSVSHRDFDLSQIANIVIYKVNASDGDRLLFDDFRLENN